MKGSTGGNSRSHIRTDSPFLVEEAVEVERVVGTVAAETVVVGHMRVARKIVLGTVVDHRKLVDLEKKAR